MLNKIKYESYHFKNYYNKPNIVVLDKILELQNEIFTVEDKKYRKSIYNQYCYEITCNIEFLLQLTYKKKYEENYPQQREFLESSHIDIRKFEYEKM